MASPKGRIVGLVDASGPGGVLVDKPDAWNLVLHLAAWRESGGSVVQQRLRCELPVTKNELRALMDAVDAYRIVELEATSSTNGVVKLERIARIAATDPEQLNAENFKSRMTLQSISIEETGEFTFWHDDGDLFWGHSIQVWGDLVTGPTHADIAG
jgi:hypothetical protein